MMFKEDEKIIENLAKTRNLSNIKSEEFSKYLFDDPEVYEVVKVGEYDVLLN